MSLRQLFLLVTIAMVPLPQVLGKVGGDTDKIPTQPAAYTIVCVPEHSDMQAFATDPELIALRQSTDFTVYTPNDPDFKHRWAERLPQVREGQVAIIVEQQDGKKLFGAAGDTLAEVCSAAKADGVLSKINRSGGCCPLRRPQEPKDREPEQLKPLRPTLPPLIEREATKIVEKEAESNPLGIIGIIAAAMAPLSLVAGIGSYFITRSVDENEALE